MEMMQIYSGVPTGAGPLPGKMPAAESKGIFGALLNRQQAAAIAGKTAEEGDAAFLAAWLTAALPSDVSAWSVTDAAGEGMSDSSLPFGATDSPAVSPGFSLLPNTSIHGGHPSLSGAAVFADRQGAESQIPCTPADHGETEMALLPNHDQVKSGLLPSNLHAASVSAAARLTGSVAQPEIRGRAAVEATVPLGIMEHRFAELLRPVEMSFVRVETGAGQPVQNLPFVASALTPATEQAAAGLTAQGEFLPSGEAKTLNGPATELPGLMANGDFSALRPPAAAVAQPVTAENLVAKQPFPGTVNESQILDQVVGRMAGERNQDVSRMSIKLQPEELGRIEIDLTLEQGRLKAQMVAQTQQVQDVLERHLPRLREALEQQGLKLDQIQVSVDAQAGEGRGFSHQHRQGESHPRTWTGAPSLSVAGEKEEIAAQAVSSLGRVSLRI